MELLLYGIITAEGDPKAYVDGRMEDINGMIENTDIECDHPPGVMPYFFKKYWEKLKANLTSGNIKELLQLEDYSYAIVSKSEKGLTAKLYINKESYRDEDGKEIIPIPKGSLVDFLSELGYSSIKVDAVKIDEANALKVDIVNRDFVFG